MQVVSTCRSGGRSDSLISPAPGDAEDAVNGDLGSDITGSCEEEGVQSSSPIPNAACLGQSIKLGLYCVEYSSSCNHRYYV